MHFTQVFNVRILRKFVKNIIVVTTIMIDHSNKPTLK